MNVTALVAANCRSANSVSGSSRPALAGQEGGQPQDGYQRHCEDCGRRPADCRGLDERERDAVRNTTANAAPA